MHRQVLRLHVLQQTEERAERADAQPDVHECGPGDDRVRARELKPHGMQFGDFDVRLAGEEGGGKGEKKNDK